MAALLLGHCGFHSPTQEPNIKINPRILISVSCQIKEPLDPKAKGKAKGKKGLLIRLSRVFGKDLKEKLSPKQKGDGKDLMLMSLSFAVYVYISQKLVCAYCLWMSMLKQPW